MKRTMTRPNRLQCLCVMALLCAAVSQAADKPASFGKGKATGPLLSRAQLRECLAQQGRLQTLSADASKLQAGMAADEAEIKRLDAAHKEKFVSLDRTSAEAVAAYNTESQQLDKLIDAYNANTPAFNAKVEALQAERTSFAKDCDNRNYDEKDELAIKNGK